MQVRKAAFGVAFGVLMAAGAAGCDQAASVKAADAKPAPAAAEAPKAALSPEETKIQSAMSAAPEAIAKDAMIMDMAADGSMKHLRDGANGWTCVPDNPDTPGPDPMCVDKNGMAWMDAYLHHKDPPKGQVSFMYMLAGGTDASNTDPYAAKPSADNHWIKTGPHVMIAGAVPMMAGYPTSPDPDTSKPYVMFAGTPYEHLMIPVK